MFDLDVTENNYVILWQDDSIVARRQFSTYLTPRQILDQFLSYMAAKGKARINVIDLENGIRYRIYL